MPTVRTVVAGDSVIRFSEEHGFLALTIWNHPENAALREVRADMNILMPGDSVYIPDLRERCEKRPTGAKHRFRRKGIPGRFRIQIFDLNIVRANEPFRLEIDRKLHESGQTDAQGIVSCFIPARASEGELTVGEGKRMLRIPLLFGRLEPVDAVSGIQHRLTNLGYDCGEPDGQWNEQTREAIRNFQRVHGLEITGECDPATWARIETIHDAPFTYPESAATPP